MLIIDYAGFVIGCNYINRNMVAVSIFIYILLPMVVQRERSARYIMLHQMKYAEAPLEQECMIEVEPESIPLAVSLNSEARVLITGMIHA